MAAQAWSAGTKRLEPADGQRSGHGSSRQSAYPEQRIKELEIQLKEAREKAQLFEAVVNVLEKDYGVRVVKKPLGKSSRKSSSKG